MTRTRYNVPEWVTAGYLYPEDRAARFKTERIANKMIKRAKRDKGIAWLRKTTILARLYVLAGTFSSGSYMQPTTIKALAACVRQLRNELRMI